ncbi:hypothetical protein Bun01g_28720 [Bacteroides uniformis]|jgi:hypothetical protein|nr:DUF6377 domain-containing protein [Bacteroides uniformis]EDO54464.1 hypothetical protein BACUNI_01940 [Bacteroides uniformis ATCC 8492]EFA18496.1 hypothetical protein HMPREF0969_03165 [Bacteroides sp. D20]MBV4215018.1 hypothetical protein [Bacteroides uniformis]BBK88502.1 hypothetical protein Bun01g_28720 [Bacteroides uniformis]GKH25946.1 hypothetical protein CE91St10_28860 [Bacteroides uniformis]
MCRLHAADSSRADSLLLKLDQAIKERPIYMEQKELKLVELKRQLHRQIPDEERFAILGTLLDEYRSFNTDSALHMAEEREQIAIRLGNREYIDNARMNKADVLGMTGMYKEVMDLMRNIHIDRLPVDIHPYYYHIYRTVYGLMADYAVTAYEKKLYTELTDKYRDSLLLVNKDNLLIHTLIQSDQYNVRNEYDKAIRLLTDYLALQKDYEHDVAICAYTLSESYRLKGDKEKEKEYLIVSAMADMKTAVREYISLRKLAVLLYQEGDIERAYSYVKICMEDAAACNARLRKLEILEIFPIINDAYQQKTEKQQEQMKWALVSISLLSLFLLLAIFYVYKQMKKVAAARREVIDANKRLKELNDELHLSNAQLKEANHSIAENSYLKEEYIGRYMDQCSVYLEKMDNYRRSLGKIAATGNVEELYKNIKSSKFIEGELKEFYTNFDNTFLQLFPTFVEDFNALLADDEQISLKAGERMNTELRIFALIRLGITDSVKIAQFLRYSVTTIYNYRTKVRNKAAGDRDLLEQEVMTIGKSKN